MASSICARPECPTRLPPGGGVRGYCDEHAPEAVIEALEQVQQAVETQGAHMARVDLSLGAVEDLVRSIAQRR